MTHTIGMISLGCAKNQVNAEQMLYLLRQAGYEILPDPDGAELVIINTCGFIDSAKEEAIDHILAMGALKTILENIKAAYDHPDDTEARGAMITAALVAGVAFSQTRTTGIHAVSFPLTTEFHASHGAACSITLPAFIRAAKQGAAEKLRVLAGYLGYADADALADGVEALMRSMKMPVRLRELGVREADIPHIAEVGLTAAIIQLTPAEMNQETVEALLRSIL